LTTLVYWYLSFLSPVTTEGKQTNSKISKLFPWAQLLPRKTTLFSKLAEDIPFLLATLPLPLPCSPQCVTPRRDLRRGPASQRARAKPSKHTHARARVCAYLAWLWPASSLVLTLGSKLKKNWQGPPLLCHGERAWLGSGSLKKNWQGPPLLCHGERASSTSQSVMISQSVNQSPRYVGVREKVVGLNQLGVSYDCTGRKKERILRLDRKHIRNLPLAVKSLSPIGVLPLE
jgi:hypothetical protein